MKRRRANEVDAQSNLEKHENLMAELEEEVILRNRRLDLNRCDMSLLFYIEKHCSGDCKLLALQLQELKKDNKQK